MRKFNHKIAIDFLLRNSPHACRQSLANVFTSYSKIDKNKYELYDQLELKRFEDDTFCQNLIVHQNRIFPKPFFFPAIHFHHQYITDIPKRKTDRIIQPLYNKLTKTIKNLNERKSQCTSYQEAEQTISSIKPEEAFKFKKNLIYIYKWVVSQKDWGNPEIEKLAESIKKIIVGKIQEGCSIDQAEKVKKQLQNLEKAQKRKKKQAHKEITPAYQQKGKQIDDKKQ